MPTLNLPCRSLEHLEPFLASRGAQMAFSFQAELRLSTFQQATPKGVREDPSPLGLPVVVHVLSLQVQMGDTELASTKSASTLLRVLKSRGQPPSSILGDHVWVNPRKHPEIRNADWPQRQHRLRHTNLASLQKHRAFLLHMHRAKLFCRSSHQPQL